MPPSKFPLLCYTGQSCDVSPFLDSYGAVEDVLIASGATAWTNQDTGITHILVVHLGLWFGTKMPSLLMNPNHTRVHDFSVCNHPFDPNHLLGIVDTDSGMLIPLKMSGSTAYLVLVYGPRSNSVNAISLFSHLTLSGIL